MPAPLLNTLLHAGPLTRKRNEIMPSNDEIVRQRQSAIRRELDRRGIALKAVAFDAGIGYSVLLGYFPQEGGAKPVMLPTSALYALAAGEAIPPDLLSLLVPDGFAIVRVPELLNHHEIADACQDYLAAKHAAHHPESEAGEAIGPGEDSALRNKFTVISGRAA